MKISFAIVLPLTCLQLTSCRSLNSDRNAELSSANEVQSSSQALGGEISCGRARNYRYLYGNATKDTIEIATQGTFVSSAFLDEKGEFIPQSGKLFFKLPNQVGPNGVLELKESSKSRPVFWIGNSDEGTGAPTYQEIPLKWLRATFKKLPDSPHSAVTFEYVQENDPEGNKDGFDIFAQCDDAETVVKVEFPLEIRNRK